MTIVGFNNAEIDGTGASNGVTSSVGNSALPNAPGVVQIGSGAALVFDTSWSAHGLYGYKLSTGGTAVQANHQYTFTATGTWSVSIYLKTPSSFSVSPTLGRCLSTGNSVQVARFAWDTSGHIVIRDAGNVNPQTSTNTFATSTAYRVDIYGTVGSSQAIFIQWFTTLDADPLSTPTGSFSTSAQNYGTVNADCFAVGQIASLANVPAWSFDDVRWGNTAAFIGPTEISATDDPAGGLGSLVVETVSVDTISTDAPLGGMGGTSTEAVSIDVVSTDGPLGGMGGTSTETVSIDIVSTDTPLGGEGGTTTETVTVGVSVADVTAGGLGGTSSETVTFDVVVTDAPAGSLGGVWVEDVTIAGGGGVTVTDTPAGGLSGTGPAETVTYDTVITDAPFGGLGGSGAAETASVDVVVVDTPAGGIGGQSTETVTYAVVITDNLAGGLGGLQLETVSIGVIITDTPAGGMGGTSLETVTYAVVVVDTPAGGLGGTRTETVADGQPVVIQDQPYGGRGGISHETVTISTGAPPTVDIITHVAKIHVASTVRKISVTSTTTKHYVTSHVKEP